MNYGTIIQWYKVQPLKKNDVNSIYANETVINISVSEEIKGRNNMVSYEKKRM